MLFENVEVGKTPNLEAFHFEVERYPDPLGLGDSVNKIGADLNPASMLTELLTEDDYGFNLQLSGVGAEVDTASFSAVGSTLDAEANGMSLKWTNGQTLERIIETITKQTDSVLRFDPKTGLWGLKLVRDDYNPASLLILDESNSNLISDTRANWNETINEVIVSYSDRDLIEDPPPAVAQDISNFRRQGRHKAITLSFPGCYSSTLAQNLASRELAASGFSLSAIELTVDRTAWALLPGDVFRSSWDRDWET